MTVIAFRPRQRLRVGPSCGQPRARRGELPVAERPHGPHGGVPAGAPARDSASWSLRARRVHRRTARRRRQPCRRRQPTGDRRRGPCEGARRVRAGRAALPAGPHGSHRRRRRDQDRPVALPGWGHRQPIRATRRSRASGGATLVTLLVLITPVVVLGFIVALQRTEEWMLRASPPQRRWRAARPGHFARTQPPPRRAALARRVPPTEAKAPPADASTEEPETSRSHRARRGPRTSGGASATTSSRKGDGSAMTLIQTGAEHPRSGHRGIPSLISARAPQSSERPAPGGGPHG